MQWNPGDFDRQSPDSASLHPGYVKAVRRNRIVPVGF